MVWKQGFRRNPLPLFLVYITPMWGFENKLSQVKELNTDLSLENINKRENNLEIFYMHNAQV